MRVQGRQFALILFSAAGAALLLLRFPPASTHWYPGCAFRAMTGWLCPGCGGTRAVAALLHGQWSEAWLDNALIVSLLPLAGLYCGIAAWRGARQRDAEWPVPDGRQIAALLLVAFGFTVWRNLA